MLSPMTFLSCRLNPVRTACSPLRPLTLLTPPTDLRQRVGLGRRFGRIERFGRAVQHSLADAAQDGGHAKQVVGHVELPMLGGVATRCADVCAHVLGFRRDAQRGQIESAYTAPY